MVEEFMASGEFEKAFNRVRSLLQLTVVARPVPRTELIARWPNRWAGASLISTVSSAASRTSFRVSHAALAALKDDEITIPAGSETEPEDTGLEDNGIGGGLLSDI